MTQAYDQFQAIPAKRYFTIGEVSELCGVKPYVLRYWEQEFTQLRPMKRRGNRRYYQHHEVLLIRRIRELLYDQGFTISGARNQLQGHPSEPVIPAPALPAGLSADEVCNLEAIEMCMVRWPEEEPAQADPVITSSVSPAVTWEQAPVEQPFAASLAALRSPSTEQLRAELIEIREMLAI